MPFLIAAAVAVVLCPISAFAGSRIGILDRPGELKIHHEPVPVTGGFVVVVAVILATVLSGGGDPWVMGAAGLALGGGLVDDMRPLPPWVRLFVQAAAGTLLVMGGLQLEPLGALGGVALVVVTIACCNATNMLDGQDGLASGLGAIAGLGLAALMMVGGLAAALPLALAGSLAGFLVWNRPPARVYLGDGGAYAVGVLLAAAAAQTTVSGWHGLLASGACLGVFAYELVTTIVRRMVAAEPTIHGDRDHSYDRLGLRLGSRPVATLVMWALGVLAALIGMTLLAIPVPQALVLIAAVFALTVALDLRLLPVSARRRIDEHRTA